MLAALRSGCHGLRQPEMELPFETVVGSLNGDFDRLPVALRAYDARLTRIAAWLFEGVSAAVASAVARFGSERVGLFVGTSNAGIAETEVAYAALLRDGVLPASYSFRHQHAYDPVLRVLLHLSGVGGPRHVISTACSSSGKVFASAARAIRGGLIDAAVVGGVDTLCQTTLRGFFALGALSHTPCRPFCKERDGINIGEGGALFVLCRDVDASVHVQGVGESSDAYHASAPHPEGAGACAAMASALASAGLEPAAVDHVNAHGTGTALNDVAESLAIARLLGDDVPVVSTKCYTGHLLGAAGAIEAAAATICLEEGLVPAALNVLPKDDACPVNVPATVLHGTLQNVLSNSFAFGGNNVSLLLGKT